MSLETRGGSTLILLVWSFTPTPPSSPFCRDPPTLVSFRRDEVEDGGVCRSPFTHAYTRVLIVAVLTRPEARSVYLYVLYSTTYIYTYLYQATSVFPAFIHVSRNAQVLRANHAPRFISFIPSQQPRKCSRTRRKAKKDSRATNHAEPTTFGAAVLFPDGYFTRRNKFFFLITLTIFLYENNRKKMKASRQL